MPRPLTDSFDGTASGLGNEPQRQAQDPALLPYQARKEQEDHRTDHGGYQEAQKASPCGRIQRAEDEPADKSAHHTHNNVPKKTKVCDGVEYVRDVERVTVYFDSDSLHCPSASAGAS